MGLQKTTEGYHLAGAAGGFLWGIIPTKVSFFFVCQGCQGVPGSWLISLQLGVMENRGPVDFDKNQQNLWFQSCKTTNSMSENDQIFGRTSVSLFNSEVFRFESF